MTRECYVNALSLARAFRRTIRGAHDGQRFAVDLEKIERVDSGVGGMLVDNVDVRVSLLTAAAAVARKRDVFLCSAELAEEPQQIVLGGFPRIAGYKQSDHARVSCSTLSRKDVQVPASIAERASRIKSLSRYTL